MTRISPKHINHKFQKDYERIINNLSENQQLNVETLITETQKMLDNHVDIYYKHNNSTSKQHQIKKEAPTPKKTESFNHDELMKIIIQLQKEKSQLTQLVDNLQRENSDLQKIVIGLHREKFELEQELKETLEGIIN